MMISMKNIASICGVSEATVSNTLKGKGNVGNKTRERIKLVARKYNYIPNALVRGIQDGFTRTIGIIAGNEYGDAFAGQIMKGIDKAIILEDFTAITVHLQGDSKVDGDVKLIRNFKERRVDGILVIGKHFPKLEFMQELRSFHGSVVFIDEPAPGDEFEFVGSDDIAGAENITDHLISLGHKDIAFFGILSIHTGMNRFEGFRLSMSKHGIAVHHNWICDISNKKQAGESYNVVKELLQQKKRPSAVVCFNDLGALEVLAVAYDMGLKVPEQLSVTGFANLPISYKVRPTITTMSQDAEAIGETGAKLLLRRIAEKRASTTKKYIVTNPKKIFLPTKLIIRNSSC